MGQPGCGRLSRRRFLGDVGLGFTGLVLGTMLAEEAARKMAKGELTLDDFLKQFQMIRRMGSVKDILAMLPGAGSLLREVDVDDRDLKRVEAIIQSMTPEERRSPKLIGGSRKRRIASGSPSTG